VDTAPLPQPAADETQELTDYVIQQLGKHVGSKDIIYKLCELTGMSWPDAESFVHQVEADHRPDIARRRSPILLVVGAITLLAGFLMAFTSATYLARMWQSPARCRRAQDVGQRITRQSGRALATCGPDK